MGQSETGTIKYGRGEAIIGFDEAGYQVTSDLFALEFWLMMGLGLTADAARLALVSRALLNPDLSTIYHLTQLRIRSFGSAPLVP